MDRSLYIAKQRSDPDFDRYETNFKSGVLESVQVFKSRASKT